MQCSDLMKGGVQSCRAGDSVADVAAMMRDLNVGFVPVVDDDGRAVGTITDRDLATRVVASRLGLDTPVRDVMTTPVVTCRPHDDLRTAERLMGSRKKSRIVVADEMGRPVGVISLSDVAIADGGTRAGALLRSVAQREART
jgi:CBS domain-containing protein